MHPSELPPRLDPTGFPVLGSGLSPKRLRASDLDRTIYGMRMIKQQGALTLASRCRLLAGRLRNDAFFSHTTSALLWSAPLAPQWENSTSVHVSVRAPESAPHAIDVLGHALNVRQGDIILRHGLRVTSPARTWVDLAGFLDLHDLVAVGDHFLNRGLPFTTTDELRSMIDFMIGQRGVRLARTALPLLSDRSESRPESRLRVILELGGIRKPLINHTLVDSETGKQVRPDFLFAAERLIIEYQGDYHRTRTQWRKDMTRREALQADGWYVMEVNADDLNNPDELIRRIRTVLARR